MNRSFVSVIAGGFGIESGPAQDRHYGDHREITAEGVAELLDSADSVIITPGYGMAVAVAQHGVADLTRLLRSRGGSTSASASTPVAGRLPGHMNVLLAEAKVPYDIVLEMDEINDDFDGTSVVLVIGANDTVNPAAAEDPGSPPIAGMPVLTVWKADDVIVFKRSMASGYAGVQNPLFFRDNSAMLFGDAKERIDDVIRTLSLRGARISPGSEGCSPEGLRVAEERLAVRVGHELAVQPPMARGSRPTAAPRGGGPCSPSGRRARERRVVGGPPRRRRCRRRRGEWWPPMSLLRGGSVRWPGDRYSKTSRIAWAPSLKK